MMRNFLLQLFAAICLIGCHHDRSISRDDDKDRQIWTADSLSDGPYIDFERSVCDLGIVSKRVKNKISAKMDFVNKGNTPLQILKADVSCGCISADFSEGAIAPGEKGAIEVKIDVDKIELGAFSKTIVVKSNAKNKYILLKVRGTIE